MNHNYCIGKCFYATQWWTNDWLSINCWKSIWLFIFFDSFCTISEMDRIIKRIISWTLRWVWREVVRWLVQQWPRPIRSFTRFQMGQRKRWKPADRVNRARKPIRQWFKWPPKIIMTTSKCCTMIQIYWTWTMGMVQTQANYNTLFYRVTPKYSVAAIASNNSSAKNFLSNIFKKHIRLSLNWYKRQPYHRCLWISR